MNSQSQRPNNGYLAVASRTKPFYYSAINLLESIKDWYPEAQTCLVVDKDLADDRVKNIDHVIYTEKQNMYRAKLWGMSKTPFDKTFYIDADMECVHEDIEFVFDELKDCDLMFQELKQERDKVFKNRYFPAGAFRLNGGACLYNSANPKVIDFLSRWYELFNLQHSKQWWPRDEKGNIDNYTYGPQEEMRHWDQFTLWWLTNKEEEWKDLKVGIFEDDLRWNYFTSFQRFSLVPKKPPVLLHYSSAMSKDHDIYKPS